MIDTAEDVVVLVFVRLGLWPTDRVMTLRRAIRLHDEVMMAMGYASDGWCWRLDVRAEPEGKPLSAVLLDAQQKLLRVLDENGYEVVWR